MSRTKKFPRVGWIYLSIAMALSVPAPVSGGVSRDPATARPTVSGMRQRPDPLARKAPAGASVRLSPNQIIDGLPCVSFKWGNAPGISDRAGILLPVSIGKENFEFQLDTGAHASFIYGRAPAEGRAAAPDATSVTLSNIKIGDMTLPTTKLSVRRDWRAGGGLFGLDILLNRYTVIDYPRRRLCILRPDQMPEALLGVTKSTWGSLRGAKFYVPIVVNGQTYGDVFFDTGASMSHLMLEQAEWLRATGLGSPSDAPQQIEIQAWDGKRFISRAPAKGAVEVAGVKLNSPVIDTWRDDPRSFESSLTGTSGLIGNASFWDGIVILDLTPMMLFRFIEGEALNAPTAI